MGWTDIRRSLARLDAALSDSIYDHGLHLTGLDKPGEQGFVETSIAATSRPNGRRFSRPWALKFIFDNHGH